MRAVKQLITRMVTTVTEEPENGYIVEKNVFEDQHTLQNTLARICYTQACCSPFHCIYEACETYHKVIVHEKITSNISYILDSCMFPWKWTTKLRNVWKTNLVIVRRSCRKVLNIAIGDAVFAMENIQQKHRKFKYYIIKYKLINNVLARTSEQTGNLSKKSKKLLIVRL